MWHDCMPAVRGCVPTTADQAGRRLLQSGAAAPQQPRLGRGSGDGLSLAQADRVG